MVKSDKFSEPFRACKETQNLEDDIVIKREMERLRIEKEKEMLNNLKKHFDKDSEKQVSNEESLLRLKRLKHLIISAAHQFKKLNMSVEQFYARPTVNTHPYELPNSKEFLLCVREGDIDAVLKFLSKNKEYSYVYDFVSINK